MSLENQGQSADSVVLISLSIELFSGLQKLYIEKQRKKILTRSLTPEVG